MNFFVIMLLWQHILYLCTLFLVLGGKWTGYSQSTRTHFVYTVPEDSLLNPLKPAIEPYIAPTEFTLNFGCIFN